jgi:hypothetical protein
MREEDHAIVEGHREKLRREEFEKGQGHSKERLNALEEKVVKDGKDEVEAELIAKHSDKPVGCVDVGRNLKKLEVLFKLG